MADDTGPSSWSGATSATVTAPPPALAPQDEPQHDQGQYSVQGDSPLKAAQQPNPNLQPTTSTANGQIASEDAGPLLVMRPKRGGMLGVIDKMADAMTGVTRPDIYTDQKGNEYVYHPNLSRGQQWARVGADVARGAASGFAAGRGAGGEGRAALAGFQVGDQAQAQRKGQEDEIQGKVKQDMADKASMQMMQMKMAEESWKATRMQREADQNDVKFNDYQVDRIKGDGGHWIGDATHPGDIAGILKVQPDVMKHLVQTGQLRIVDKINPATMQHEGIQAFMMPESHGKDWLPPGTVGHKFDPMAGEIKPFNYSDGVSQGQRDLDDTTAAAALKAYNNDKQEQADKEATRQNVESERKTREKKAPGEMAETAAKTAQAYASANESNAKAGQTKGQTAEGVPTGLTTEAPVNGVRANYLAALPDQDRSLVQAIGEGRKADVGSYALGRSPEARRIAMEVTTAYPGFDFTRAPTYLKTREAFTSGKPADGINALNTAMEHMQQMYDNADWLTTTPLVSAYQRATGNQRAIDLKDAKTALVDELGKAYKAGALTIEDKKSWSDRINAWSPDETKGNAVSFIKLLRGKIDGYQHQWEVGAPPGAVSPIHIYSPGAQAAYDHIMKNQPAPAAPGATPPPAAPAPTPGPGTAAPAAVKIIPGEPQIKMVDGSIGVARNGQWVKAQP